MAVAFDREQLLDAFDRIGEAAAAAGVCLDLAVYGGSALMLASNFRYSTEDVDIAEIARPWPEWLVAVVESVAQQNGWSSEWLNDAVALHLSPLADSVADHRVFGSFPRAGAEAGLRVVVPKLEYILAMKLKAMRVLELGKGEQEARDIANLMRAAGISDEDELIEVLTRYFPRSAEDPAKVKFLLRHVVSRMESSDAPAYLG